MADGLGLGLAPATTRVPDLGVAMQSRGIFRLLSLFPLLRLFQDGSDDGESGAPLRRQFQDRSGGEFGASTAPFSGGNIDRERQKARRGEADLTFGNVLSAARFGLGLASGTGPIKLGARLLANRIAPGLFGNPMPEFEGQVSLRPEFSARIGPVYATAREAFEAQRQEDQRRALAMAAAQRANDVSRHGGRGDRRAAGGAGAFGGGEKTSGGFLGGAGGV